MEKVTIKELALLKYQKRCTPQVGSSVSFRIKVAMKPLLLCLIQKANSPPTSRMEGVLMVSCLGYEEFLKRKAKSGI